MCYQIEGRRRSDPSRKRYNCTRQPYCERPIQLPPLSSPRRGPQRGVFGSYTGNNPATYAPQEEKTRAPTRANAET